MSIVSFDEQIKSDKRLSDVIFDMINHLYDGGLSGTRREDECAKIVVLEGKIFSNQISMGKRNEEDVEAFENEIPADDYAFIDQKNLKDSLKRVKDQNTAALMAQDVWNKQSSPIDGYSKGLKKVS